MPIYQCANPMCRVNSNKKGFGIGLAPSAAHIDRMRLVAGSKVCNTCYYDKDPANNRWPPDYYVPNDVRPSAVG